VLRERSREAAAFPQFPPRHLAFRQSQSMDQLAPEMGRWQSGPLQALATEAGRWQSGLLQPLARGWAALAGGLLARTNAAAAAWRRPVEVWVALTRQAFFPTTWDPMPARVALMMHGVALIPLVRPVAAQVRPLMPQIPPRTAPAPPFRR
jgi:hypothetical protein